MVRRLSAHERALWSRVAATVRPLPGKVRPAAPPPEIAVKPPAAPAPPPPRAPAAPRKPAPPVVTATLDGGWDRRLARGDIVPDRVIDLHGHTLAAAHAVLTDALDRATGNGERFLLVVTGKGRADRPGRIRHELAHWLDRADQRSRIAALRPAHPRHGGSGAFYLILRRK